MMRLHVSTCRRIATLFFIAIYATKSFRWAFLPLRAFSSPSASQQQQYQQFTWPAHTATETSLQKEANLKADCQQHGVSPPPPPPRHRINMTIRRGYLAQNLYHKYLKCGIPSRQLNDNDSNSTNRTSRHMHPSMRDTPGIFDFTTFLSTDLKILVMGDSVAIQISQTLEEMLGAQPENRNVYRYSHGPHESLHISAPIRGGGVVAGWRLLGMFLPENVKRKLPNVGPGWRMEHVYNITHHTYHTSDDDNYKNTGARFETTTKQVGSFDVLLFHIPIGWIKDYDSINNSTLMETVLLAGDLFGVQTVVFNVPSFTNNIITAQQLQSLRDVQNRVVAFANGFIPSSSPLNLSTTSSSTATKNHNSVQRVLTLRMDRLMDETMEWNAQLMGMIPSKSATTVTTSTATNKTDTDGVDNDDWRLVPLGRPVRKGKTRFIHHVAQSCSALPNISSSSSTCPRNHFSLDGMHVCMETMGGRLFAGLGCVLGCVYNNNNNNKDSSNYLAAGECQHQASSSSSSSSSRRPSSTALVEDHQEKQNVGILNCANACNDRYLRLTSVNNEVLD